MEPSKIENPDELIEKNSLKSKQGKEIIPGEQGQSLDDDLVDRYNKILHRNYTDEEIKKIVAIPLKNLIINADENIRKTRIVPKTRPVARRDSVDHKNINSVMKQRISDNKENSGPANGAEVKKAPFKQPTINILKTTSFNEQKKL